MSDFSTKCGNVLLGGSTGATAGSTDSTAETDSRPVAIGSAICGPFGCCNPLLHAKAGTFLGNPFLGLFFD